MDDQSAFRLRLQRSAAVYYMRLPSSLQQELCYTFRKIDRNGDGRISQAELLKWDALQNLLSSGSKGYVLSKRVSSLFAFIDADNDDELDFEEFKSLFIILLMPSEFCDGCGKLLVESAYACIACKSMMQNGMTDNNFYLCANCYGDRNRVGFLRKLKTKLVHPHSDFCEHKPLLTAAMEEVTNQIQCSVCRAYHRGNVEGALIKDHVYVFENNVAVCEWCIASPCRACGVYFEGSMASATPGGWAVKGSQICVTCQLGRMAINSSPQDPCSMEFLTKLASSKVFQECSTCITKYKNGALVRELEQGISLSSERQNSSRGFFTASSSVPQHGSSLYCHYSDPFLQAQPYYNCMYPFANQSNPAQYTMGNSAFPPQIFPCNQPYGPYVASSHGGYHASNMPGMQQTIQPPSSAVGGISDMTGLIDQINAASTLASVLRMFINSSKIK